MVDSGSRIGALDDSLLSGSGPFVCGVLTESILGGDGVKIR